MKTEPKQAKHKVVVICGNCEHEWDGDKRSAQENCPTCGCEPGEHIIRVEEEGNTERKGVQ